MKGIHPLFLWSLEGDEKAIGHLLGYLIFSNSEEAELKEYHGEGGHIIEYVREATRFCIQHENKKFARLLLSLEIILQQVVNP